jgi:hypothetical protein
VTVHYTTYPASVGNLQDQRYSLSAAGALPANDRAAFNYSLPQGKLGRLEFRGPAGNLISVSAALCNSGKTTFSTAELPPGVYYATLVIDGKFVVTKKVPVFH